MRGGSKLSMRRTAHQTSSNISAELDGVFTQPSTFIHFHKAMEQVEPVEQLKCGLHFPGLRHLH
jgi:hypothetical protein